jgi:hypothetical protein
VAVFLVIKEFRGALRGRVTTLPAGALLDDTKYDVPTLLASGVRAVEVDANLLSVLQQGDRNPIDALAAAVQSMYEAPPGGGDVLGPAGATDNALARFDTATGKRIQNSLATLDDAGNLALPGTVDGRDVGADGGVLDAHVANTANPHATSIANLGAGTLAQLNAAISDANVTQVEGILVFGANSIASTTAPRWLYPGYSDQLAQTTVIRMVAPTAGTLRNLRVYHNQAAGNGNLILYRVFVAAVGTSLQVSMASTATQGSDLVNSAAVSAGSTIDIEVTKALSIGSTPGDIVATMEMDAA